MLLGTKRREAVSSGYDQHREAGPELTETLDSPELFKAGWREKGFQVPQWHGVPVWPTNTIRICQSASHTFTVLSREAVTMASTSSQYARSEMVLGGKAGLLSNTSCEHACTPAQSGFPSWTCLKVPVPGHLLTFCADPGARL